MLAKTYTEMLDIKAVLRKTVITGAKHKIKIIFWNRTMVIKHHRTRCKGWLSPTNLKICKFKSKNKLKYPPWKHAGTFPPWSGFPFVLAFQDFVSAAAFSGEVFFFLNWKLTLWMPNWCINRIVNRLVYFWLYLHRFMDFMIFFRWSILISNKVCTNLSVSLLRHGLWKVWGKLMVGWRSH